jgi:hypothetical protein
MSAESVDPKLYNCPVKSSILGLLCSQSLEIVICKSDLCESAVKIPTE